VRLFVAVPAPEAVRTAAVGVMERLRGAGDVRWVRPELLHLTLKFLGATPAEKMPAIAQILEENANKFSRIVVELGGAGAFPNERRPQTLWLGLSGEGASSLGRLAEGIERGLEPLGFAREQRAFRPHLTIGRVKSPRGQAELSQRLRQVAAAGSEPSRVEWPVEEIQLIRSDLRPAGPEYTVLRSFPFRKG
jgi:2'-5' RNA ligase